ncbi:hypothetical protein ES695_02625 [Candidatus Atribacteria bacterium 1244-E10-H5-B2]|nr:MAG: hypothetical protein ES695_02625 [Candidatus Atribacteria bacterium 1244-E10-H5-B2]
MTNKTMENYIAQLESRVKWIESCQKDSEAEEKKTGKFPAGYYQSASELLTLKTVIRDLKHFVTATPFSYWDWA